MLLTEIATAYKRALHWWPDFDPEDGPHTALRHPIGSNYSMILDGADDEFEYLCHLHEFARGLNALCEHCMVRDNGPLKEALACFLSRCWFDPRKLA